MIETGNFSDFNLVRKRELTECEDIEVRRILLEKADCFPLIRCLLTETTRFYRLTSKTLCLTEYH